MSPVEQIAEVLAQHDWDCYANEDGTGGVLCPCGWKVVEGTGRDVNAHLAEHITLALGLTEETREGINRIPQGLDIVVECRTGTSARAWCNQCDFGSNGWVSPREAYDWAYEHAEEKHGYVPLRESRWVSGWSVVDGDPK